MEQTIYTPRLRLTLITKAPRGSEEFDWLHEYRSNEQATWWSITPRSKTPEDTEKTIASFLPTDPPAHNSRKIMYAVHETREAPIEGSPQPTNFIGIITLTSLNAHALPLPATLGFPEPDSPTTMTVELAYAFLPHAWGKGYATESLCATFDGCRRAIAFWAPYEKVYVRAIVNALNPPSLRVLKKMLGMEEKGMFVVERGVWLAGEWRVHHDLHIFGMYLVG